MSKYQPVQALKETIASLKQSGKRVVFTNGCFDLLHPGHIKILRESKAKGDYLVVGLNSDSSIRKIKGDKRPILDQEARIVLLESIEFVDFIVVFDEETPRNIIEQLRPTVLVKGADWADDKIVGREFADEIARIALCEGYSTSNIIETIVKKYGQSIAE